MEFRKQLNNFSLIKIKSSSSKLTWTFRIYHELLINNGERPENLNMKIPDILYAILLIIRLRYIARLEFSWGF